MASPQILVIDDERSIRHTLTLCLADAEVSVRTAVNGEEALRLMAAAPADLVLLDMRLPGIGGLELLGQLRSRWPQARVVVISAHSSVSLAVQAMKLGAVDWIEKPFSPGQIRAAVQAAVAVGSVP